VCAHVVYDVGNITKVARNIHSQLKRYENYIGLRAIPDEQRDRYNLMSNDRLKLWS